MFLELYRVWIIILTAPYISCIKDDKILILGAGMSGLSAAKTLLENGYTNIQIIEASGRVGGRIKSAYLGGYTVEMGGGWIYGFGDNPMYKLATEKGLSFTTNTEDDDTWVFRDANGDNVTTVGDEYYHILETAISGALNMSAELRQTFNPSDYSAASVMRHNGWNALDTVATALEVSTIDIETAQPPTEISGIYELYSLFSPYELFNDPVKNFAFVNDTRGYQYLAEQMYGDLNSKANFVEFNKTVERIAGYKSTKVRVYDAEGTKYEGDYAICTFSVGVLQHRNVDFQPDLPDWKQFAIDKLGIGGLMFAYIQFPTAFWDEVAYLIYPSNTRGYYTNWLNMNYVYPGSNIIQLTLTGQTAIDAENKNDTEIIDEAIAVLQLMYPSASISTPYSSDYVISRWMTDPLTRGTWSFRTPGVTPKDVLDAGMRIGRLYFAGEHLNATNHGFVHSAYYSGINTALDLMSCIEDAIQCKYRDEHDPRSSLQQSYHELATHAIPLMILLHVFC